MLVKNILHDLVCKITDEIDGLGPLYAYDTAPIIGTFLGFQPEEVYLHCETRTGARALGFRGALKYLEVSQLPQEIQVLEPYEIENFLCIYADDLKIWAART
jgi:hypothetical protein